MPDDPIQQAEFLAAMLGITPEQAAEQLGISDVFAANQAQETQNRLLMTLSNIAGSPETQLTLEQFQQRPEWEGFVRLATEAGYDPAQLVNFRSFNIGQAQSDGFENWLRATALLGGAGVAGSFLAPEIFGSAGAAAGGGTGTAAAGSALAPVTTSASAIPLTAAQQSALAGIGAVAPASAGLATSPFLSGGALTGGGGGFFSQLGEALGIGGGESVADGILPRLGGLQGLGALIGGASGLLGSVFGPDEQTVTQQTQLPPSVQEALDFIINQSMGLANTGSLVPGLSETTLSGINALSSPLSGPGFDALSGLAGGMTNPFASAMNPFAMAGNDLSGVTDFITDAATRAVGDQFSMAGRSGSPAQSLSLAKTISRELAPFAFGARENQLGRQFAAGENLVNRQFTGGESMLDRQLSAALPLLNLQRQSGLDQLVAGGILDEQARRAALEPFMRLEMLTGPLVSAISGAPRSSSTTTPLFNNPLLSGLGGALAGSQIGGLFG